MHDPLANHNEVKKYYNVKLEKNINKNMMHVLLHQIIIFLNL